ncbi:hypothetical protein [Celeribacter naphthalenivorans]|uniref:hypothetical protein n=1 Tax=Celeribacter naphthalenivorans TaxID=1614694 RepID=UPI001CFA9E4A|nr:hypothetical protein [Celeribacter naphthalenivorans]
MIRDDDDRDWIIYPAPETDHDTPAPDGPGAEVDMVEIIGSEMPEPFSATWSDERPIWEMVGSSEIQDDDPDAVREAGAREVAKALGVGTDWLRLHPNQRVREVYALIGQYFSEGHFREGVSLDVFIGLRPDGGRPSLAREIAIFERNRGVRELAQMEPFTHMQPTQAAKVIKWMYERTHGSRWSWHGDDQPPRITEAHKAVLREIAATGACPSAQSVAEHIRAMRMRRK